MYLIVGNATALIGKSLGEKIDVFEDVVRFNNFKLDGYENDLGMKTTMYVYNDLVIPECAGRMTDVPHYIFDPHNKFVRRPVKLQGHQHMLPHDFFMDQRKQWGPPFSKDKWFSCGLAMILYLLYLNNEEVVYITNFDFCKGPNHYFDNDKPGPHAWDAEERVVYELVGQGRVRVLE